MRGVRFVCIPLIFGLTVLGLHYGGAVPRGFAAEVVLRATFMPWASAKPVLDAATGSLPAELRSPDAARWMAWSRNT